MKLAHYRNCQLSRPVARPVQDGFPDDAGHKSSSGKFQPIGNEKRASRKSRRVSQGIRFVIARCSPERPCEVGLRIRVAEKRGDVKAFVSSAVRSLRSGFPRSNAKYGHLSRILAAADRVSPQFRLRGGEGGIRTLGTGVSPYNGLANRRIRPLCHLSGLYKEQLTT